MSRQRSEQTVGAICIATAASLWGLWPLWVRSGSAGGAATATVALLVAGGLALPLAVRASAARGPRPARAWGLLVALGLSNAMNAWCYFRALAEGAVAPAALSHYLAPVLVALAAPVVLREARSSRTPLALVLALGGTALLLFTKPGGGGDGGAARHAVLLGGTSAIFYATNVLLSKLAAASFADAEMFAYHALVGAVALAPVTALPGAPADWLWPAVGGVVSALVPGLIYYLGLRRIPAERVGVLTYLEVPAAVVVGWLAFGETPARAAALGGAAILCAGVLVVTAPER